MRLTRGELAGLAMLLGFIAGIFTLIGYEGNKERKLFQRCYDNGYPDVRRNHSGFYCVRRINNSDEIVSVSSLER